MDFEPLPAWIASRMTFEEQIAANRAAAAAAREAAESCIWQHLPLSFSSLLPLAMLLWLLFLFLRHIPLENEYGEELHIDRWAAIKTLLAIDLAIAKFLFLLPVDALAALARLTTRLLARINLRDPFAIISRDVWYVYTRLPNNVHTQAMYHDFTVARKTTIRYINDNKGLLIVVVLFLFGISYIIEHADPPRDTIFVDWIELNKHLDRPIPIPDAFWRHRMQHLGLSRG